MGVFRENFEDSFHPLFARYNCGNVNLGGRSKALDHQSKNLLERSAGSKHWIGQNQRSILKAWGTRSTNPDAEFFVIFIRVFPASRNKSVICLIKDSAQAAENTEESLSILLCAFAS